MAKAKTHYVCQTCSGVTAKWQGQCPHCEEWNTLEESLITTSETSRYQGLTSSSQKKSLAAIEIEVLPRIPTGLNEFDRVLGGGLVPGGVVLIGGDPGIGKSTLLLQAGAHLSQTGLLTLYASGEESLTQIAMRATRIGISAPDLQVISEIELEKLIATIRTTQPNIVVIDSIQTIYSQAFTSAPGSVTQVKECSAQLTRLAKDMGFSLILVGHVTKEGNLAGPRVLEHIVDAVVYFEGDTQSSYRLIRAIKNRYGAVNELGVFAMTEKGLKVVSNPSALFLTQHDREVPGSCVLVTQEGTRPLLIEIQALVDTSFSPNPKRLSLGLEAHRIAMLLAVLHRHGRVSCHDQDVFLNAVGGVKITEPAADLAVLLAVYSSMKDKSLPKDLVVFGEIGLSGEIRPCVKGQERLKEAAKLGFKKAIIPKLNQPKQGIQGLTIFAVDSVDETIHLLDKM